MGQPEIFNEPISKETIQRLADEEFGNMVKFVVDLEERSICAGGGLHSDEEQLLIDSGSRQENLWGANLWIGRPYENRYEFTSMINIRPSNGNRSQLITSLELCEKISQLADVFFQPFYAKP